MEGGASVGWADGFAGRPLRLWETQGDQRAPHNTEDPKIKQAKLPPRIEDAIQSIMKFMEAVDGKVSKSCRSR